MEEENKQYQILKNDFDKLNNENKFIEEKTNLMNYKKNWRNLKMKKIKLLKRKIILNLKKKNLNNFIMTSLINSLMKKNKNDNLKKMYESQKKLYNKSFPFEILNEEEKILNINFITFDENIHYSIICKNTDKLINIINKFYDKYPEYKEFKNILI